MLFVEKQAHEKRADLRKMLKSGKLLKFVGSYSGLTSLLIEQHGFDGVYLSGAVLANDLGYPDIGLTGLSEVSQRARILARNTNLPSLLDIDTGFGPPMSAARSIQEVEELGISAIHMEDQVNPKRCGHLDNKDVVSKDEMCQKIKAAVGARRDKNLVIMARTDARGVESLDQAIDRAKAYVDAGADMIFPEALKDEKEFEKFRKEVKVPLLANMTEFGKSRLIPVQELENLGLNLVIFPVSLVRVALGAVERALEVLKKEGTLEPVVPEMMTRKRLYEVLRYEDYNTYDQNLFNFKL